MTSSAVVFGVKVGVKIYITKQYKTTNKKWEKAENAVFSTFSANKTIQNNTHFQVRIKFESRVLRHKNVEISTFFYFSRLKWRKIGEKIILRPDISTANRQRSCGPHSRTDACKYSRSWIVLNVQVSLKSASCPCSCGPASKRGCA